MADNKNTAEKRRILSVAARLFRERSYLNTSVDEIAAHLKINKAMIYYYFKSKGFLLYAIMSSSIDERTAEARLVLSLEKKPLEKMKILIDLIVKSHTDPFSLAGVAQFELKNLPRNLMRSYISKRDKFEQIFRDVLQEGIEKGHFRKEINVKMSVRFIFGILNSLSVWYRESGPLSPEEITGEVLDFIAYSICHKHSRRL
jgi:AcrR family transcriptional regulator